MSASLLLAKKSASLLLAVLIVGVGLYIPLSVDTPRAEALTCGDTPGNPCFSVEINPAVLGGIGLTAANSTTQTVIANVLNGLAWTLAKVAIQSMTQSIVTWINSGFQGSPAFVTDLKSNLQILSDTVVEDFYSSFEKDTGLDIHTPFQDQVRNAIRDSYYRNSSDRGRNPDYDLYSISNDPQGFLNGQFNKDGGLSAWFSVVLNSDNNPVGAFLKGKNELAQSIETFRENRLNELSWGHGFLSWRGSCNKAKGGADPSLASKDDCLVYNVETPGSVIENQLETQLGTGVRQLEIADSINEIVSALMGQLVNHVLGDGGLSGVSHHTSSGGSSILDQATDPGQYSGSATNLASGFASNVSKEQKNTSDYQQNWERIGGAASQAKAALESRSCLEYPNPQDTIATTVEPVLASASAATSTAAIALAKLADIQTRAANVQKLPAAQQVNAINTISKEHDDLVRQGVLVDDSDVQNAATQSLDQPGTLYTQMHRIVTTCSIL